jgi:hypothetical protein
MPGVLPNSVRLLDLVNVNVNVPVPMPEKPHGWVQASLSEAPVPGAGFARARRAQLGAQALRLDRISEGISAVRGGLGVDATERD